VAKFIGLHAQVVALNTSGTSEDDVLGETLELWKQKDKNGRGFAYLHCWAILRYIPRWMEIREESRRVIPVKRKPSSTFNSEDNMAGDSGLGDGSNPATPDLTGAVAGTSSDALLGKHSAFNSRPVRSKAAKEAEQMGKARDAALKAQARATENMTVAMREKVLTISDQQALHLFSLSETQFTDPVAPEYL
jgi:hypothetical protein